MTSLNRGDTKAETKNFVSMVFTDEVLNTASGVGDNLASILSNRMNGHTNGHDKLKSRDSESIRLIRVTFPIYEVLVNLHSDFGAFIKQGLKSHEAMGFLNHGHEPLDIKPLVSGIWDAINRLEAIYSAKAEGNPLELMNRAMAVNTLAPLKYFLLGLNSIQYRDGLSKSDASSIVHQCIELEQIMAAQIIEIDQIKLKLTTDSHTL